MSKLPRFRVIFEEEAGEFIFLQSKAKARKLLDICYSIADNPYSISDYRLPDADDRIIEHVSTEGYVFAYWIDGLSKRVVIVEIEKED